MVETGHVRDHEMPLERFTDIQRPPQEATYVDE